MMDSFFFIATLVLCGTMLLVLIRALLGPTVLDRLVAVNAIGTKATILLLLIGLMFHRLDMFLDIAIAYALLNFITSIAVSRYFLRTKSLHPEEEI